MPRDLRAPRTIGDLEFQDRLGKGSFGTVYRAKNKLNGELLAVKEITGKSVRSKLEFLKEAKVLRMVNHPCLLRLVAVFVQEEDNQEQSGVICQKLYLVTEYCSGGALSNLLVNEKVAILPWKTRVRFAHECAMGLDALHENNLIHRDLKSENCLLKAIPDRAIDMINFSHLSIVLGDFGLARWYTTGASVPRRKGKGDAEETSDETDSTLCSGGSTSADSAVSITSSVLGAKPSRRRVVRRNSKMTVRGTPWTMAPELMDPKYSAGYTLECDIFSLGVVLLEIACRRLAQNIPRNEALSVDMSVVEAMSINPVSKRKTFFGKKVRARRDSIRDACPPKYLDIVRQCVHVTPEERPLIHEVEEALRSLRSDALPDIPPPDIPDSSHDETDQCD